MLELMHQHLQTKLNEEQYTAATHIETSSLILAGAGSGKTRTLTYKIAYLIFAHNIIPHKILAVTFTNKAANEMKERLIELSKEIDALPRDTKHQTDNATQEGFDSFLQDVQHEAKQPTLSIKDLKRVGTFHSIFLKILKEEITKLNLGYKKSFSIYDSNESLSLIKSIIKEKKRDDDIKAKEAKGIISKNKNAGRLPKEVLLAAMSDYDEKIGEIYDIYQKELIKHNALDFDDLLLLTYQLFKNHASILQKRQKKFDYIMVDEAQDTNQIQFDLIKMLGSHCQNITLIGDDYQSIYGRRGAVMENFLNVKKYRSDIVIHKLQINYRSRPHIVEAGSHIIKKNAEQYEKNIQAHRKGEDHIIILTLGDETQEAQHIIGMIKKIKESKNAKRGDMAILYRTNSQSQVFEQVLVTEGIPYKIRGGFKFFDRKEIKDIVSYLKFMRNPQDNLALKRIINTPSRKIGKTTINKLEQAANEHKLSMYQLIEQIDTVPLDINNGTRKKIKQFGTQIQFRSEGFPNLKPSDLINKIVNDIKYKEYLIKEEGDINIAEEKFDNIGQLINMADKITETGIAGMDKFMDEIALMTDIVEDGGEIDAVKLMTIHSSKGLEFPGVFIVGCEENIFPLSRSTLDTKQLEEERRLMYVAITRARDHLFVSHALSRRQRGNITYNPPSRFISELPENLSKSYDLTNNYEGRTAQNNISEGDKVRHKLFGSGEAIEIRNNAAIVRFDNPKYGLRKIETRLLEIA